MKKITKSELVKIRDKYRALSYKDKVGKFEELNNATKYKVLNESEFEKMWGYSFSQIDGYNRLSDVTKSYAVKGILNLVNNWGMEQKADCLVYKIDIDRKYARFVMYHTDGFSYVDRTGSVG